MIQLLKLDLPSFTSCTFLSEESVESMQKHLKQTDFFVKLVSIPIQAFVEVE